MSKTTSTKTTAVKEIKEASGRGGPRPATATAKGRKAVKNFYAGSVESVASQNMLKRIAKATSEKPLVAKKALKGQYPNRIARMLATLGLVAQETRESIGVVFFANDKTTSALAQ